MNYITLPPAWYYRFGNIHPVLHETLNATETLVYSMELHGLDRTTFKHYSFSTFPVPVAKNSSRQFSLLPHIAFNDISKNWFIPQLTDCVGSDPMLCRIRKKFTSTSCETAILSSGAPGFEQCQVKFSHSSEHEIVQSYLPDHFRSNLILNAMKPSTLSFHCAGRGSEKLEIEGIYRLHLNTSCSISLNDKWIISRISSLSRMVHLEAPSRMDIPFFEVKWPTALNISSPIDENFHYKPLTVSLGEVGTLQGFERWSDKFHSNSAFTGYLIAFILGAGTLISLWILWKTGQWSRCVLWFRSLHFFPGKK
jgi:hypothetical protein